MNMNIAICVKQKVIKICYNFLEFISSYMQKRRFLKDIKEMDGQNYCNLSQDEKMIASFLLRRRLIGYNLEKGAIILYITESGKRKIEINTRRW